VVVEGFLKLMVDEKICGCSDDCKLEVENVKIYEI
jgi:hypothetical protein